MDWDELSQVKGRFNPWCEKKGLHSDDKEKSNRALKFLSNPDLTTFEKYCFYLHELTDCQGIEFVGFSNVRLNDPVKLSNDLILAPCFYPTLDGKNMKDPITIASSKMSENSRFVYDGWFSIVEWTPDSIRNAIKKIDRYLALFSLPFGSYFEWRPKYYSGKNNSISNSYEIRHVNDIKNIINIFDKWKENDREAIYQSIGSISQSMRVSESEAKFVFYFSAIESLATYIDNCDKNSIFYNLKLDKRSDKEKEQERNTCMDENLKNYEKNRMDAVTKAYQCRGPGSTKIIKNYLEEFFENDSEKIQIFFKGDKTKGIRSLYYLRNIIVHGGHKNLNQVERDVIMTMITDIEKITLKFVRKVLESCLGKDPYQETTITSQIPIEMLFGSGGARYVGPVHMGIIYTQQH